MEENARTLEGRVAARLGDVASACVALSGGVDSSIVFAVAARALGPDRVVAVTVVAPVMIGDEVLAAQALAAELGVAHVAVEVPLMDDPDFVANSRERCYTCKAMVLDAVARVADERGMAVVLDGANRDDLGDERPGMRAAAERGVRHPLIEAGLGKAEARRLARGLGLGVWDAPAQACLASRIPFGERISEEALRRIGAAEKALRELGFGACRVRAHGPLARVEVPVDEIGRAAGAERGEIARRLRALGFTWVTLDLVGLRTGSMNEAPLEASQEEAAPEVRVCETTHGSGADAPPDARVREAAAHGGDADAPPDQRGVVP